MIMKYVEKFLPMVPDVSMSISWTINLFIKYSLIKNIKEFEIPGRVTAKLFRL